MSSNQAERVMGRREAALGAVAPSLSIRVDPSNPDHHLWNNNGTWWCHYTVHLPPWRQERLRVSLHTRSCEEARARRDVLLGLAEGCSLAGHRVACGGAR